MKPSPETINSASLIASVSRRAGGLYESVRRLHQSLLSPDMRVDVLAMRDEFTAEDAEAWKPLSVQTFLTKGPWQFGYAPGLAEATYAGHYDILHTHGLWMYPSLVALKWHRQTRLPYMVSPHGMLDPWALRNSGWKKRIAAALFESKHLREAACIRALCQSEAESVRKVGLRRPICVIPNGIDVPVRAPGGESPWGDKLAGRKVLLYLGRIHPKKNLPALISAWATVQRDPSMAANWALVIAGWDQNGHEGELQQMCEDLSLAVTRGYDPGATSAARPSVLFVGPTFGEAKAAAYHHADAFVLPSLSEGLPMVVLEAWSHRKPVIMTPECNLPEGFASGAALKCGATPNSIWEQVRCLASMSETERHDMGARGHSLVAQRFAWPIVARHMRDVYKWCIGGGAPPDVVYG